jgi:hypothetical protein
VTDTHHRSVFVSLFCNVLVGGVLVTTSIIMSLGRVVLVYTSIWAAGTAARDVGWWRYGDTGNAQANCAMSLPPRRQHIYINPWHQSWWPLTLFSPSPPVFLERVRGDRFAVGWYRGSILSLHPLVVRRIWIMPLLGWPNWTDGHCNGWDCHSCLWGNLFVVAWVDSWWYRLLLGVRITVDRVG